MTEKNTQLHTT